MNIRKLAVFMLTVLLSFTAMAETTARDVVVDTTDKVMKVVLEAQKEGYFEQDPQRFYSQIETVLGEVIDFDRFARGVMGKYASKQYYVSLASEREKEQFKERIKRFTDTFKDGLVQTYAKGLLSFNGNRIEVLPLDQEDQGRNSAVVEQHIYGNQEKPYLVQYKMRKDSAGDWKLANVTIEAVNLGKVYQSQFYSAAKQYKGDLDKVVDRWSVEPGRQASDDKDLAKVDRKSS